MYQIELISQLVNVYLDNIFIGLGDHPSEPEENGEGTHPVHEESVWLRNHEMTYYQIWVNEDNNFEFVFWWAYKDHNHVHIYDMADTLVWRQTLKKKSSILSRPTGWHVYCKDYP
jgi:hypothetical protein